MIINRPNKPSSAAIAINPHWPKVGIAPLLSTYILEWLKVLADYLSHSVSVFSIDSPNFIKIAHYKFVQDVN